ncbi:hypothetical protein PMAYCL1PPCAC_08577, partial [Pristionchus mayeri]
PAAPSLSDLFCSSFQTLQQHHLVQLQLKHILPPTPSYSPTAAYFMSETPTSNSYQCLACGEKADGVHFGAVVCAACSAFFRRSVVDQRVYSCTGCSSGMTSTTSQGWTRERDERAASRLPGICRYCRFQRCMAVGMRPEEVQPKRLHGTGRLRSLRFTNSRCSLEDLRVRRFEMERIRQNRTQKNASYTVDDIRNTMKSEYELFLNLIMQSSIMAELLNDASPFPSPDVTHVIERSTPHRERIRELFLFSFQFDTIRSTVTHGGIQSDSLILPTGVRLPMDCLSRERLFASDANIVDPGCLARLSNDFLFSVLRVVARSMQALHMDQNEVCWLYAICISSAVIPFGRRSSFRDDLISSVSLSDEESIERQGQILLLLSSMAESLAHLRQFLQVAELAGACLT